MRLQLRTVLEDFSVKAAKTGMLFLPPIIRAVADEWQPRLSLVVDPVSVSQSGSRLLQEDAVIALIEEMLPGCDLRLHRPEAEMPRRYEHQQP